MSMTLILWKAPVTGDPDEAKALLEQWYEHGDDSAFEPSEDIALVADLLRSRWPDDFEGEVPDNCPWADMPFEQSERLLAIHIRWGADDVAIAAIYVLAKKHELVLYDPQGPDVFLPTDPLPSPESIKLGFADYAKTILFVLAGALIFAAGWWLPVPLLNWVLMIVGGFLASVAIFLLTILIFGPRPDGRGGCDGPQ